MTDVVEPTPANLDRVAERVREGSVVAPSDTNLGLPLDPDHDAAIEGAYETKGCDPAKPLTLFVRDPDDWRRLGAHDDSAVVESVVEAFWPGPLNVVLKATDELTHDPVLMDGTVSIGCPENRVWRAF